MSLSIPGASKWRPMVEEEGKRMIGQSKGEGKGEKEMKREGERKGEKKTEMKAEMKR